MDMRNTDNGLGILSTYLWWDDEVLAVVTHGTQCEAGRSRGVRVDTRGSQLASGVMQDVNRSPKRQPRHVYFVERNITLETNLLEWASRDKFNNEERGNR